MAKINKQKAMELIISELDKGSTYSECYAVMCSNVQLSERAFANYWKEANSIFAERRLIIEEEKLAEAIRLGKEETKKNIMSKEDTLVILTEIAKDYESSPSDRIKAIDQYSKIQGLHAASRLDVTSEGEKISLPTMILFTGDGEERDKE